jgi:hypothetical protein
MIKQSILKRSRQFCDNINIFQCIEGVLLKTVLPICIYYGLKNIIICQNGGVLGGNGDGLFRNQ